MSSATSSGWRRRDGARLAARLSRDRRARQQGRASAAPTGGVERRDGFVEYLEQNEPNIEIVAEQNADGDQAKSADATKAMLQANPDLAGLNGTNEGAAIGVVQGAKELGNTDATIVGFDSGKAQLDAIKDGSMLGAVTQSPLDIGSQTARPTVASTTPSRRSDRGAADDHAR